MVSIGVRWSVVGGTCGCSGDAIVSMSAGFVGQCEVR